jgi:hypothetical protein
LWDSGVFSFVGKGYIEISKGSYASKPQDLKLLVSWFDGDEALGK